MLYRLDRIGWVSESVLFCLSVCQLTGAHAPKPRYSAFLLLFNVFRIQYLWQKIVENLAVTFDELC